MDKVKITDNNLASRLDVITIQEFPNYLESDLIDDDIKVLFENRQYLCHEPLLAQLIKELKLQNRRGNK